MALPQLNTSPSYTTKVPSTGQDVNFRPFLVKEQKVLLIAYESQDKAQIIKGILNTLESCIEDDIDVHSLSTFDVDYLFTQIRGKSVGEKVDIKLKCQHCEEYNDIQVNLDEIVPPTTKESTRIVELNKDVSVQLKYPSYSLFLRNPAMLNAESNTETIMEVLISCMHSVLTNDDNILLKDEPKEEVVKFLDSMTSAQFEMITDFVEKMPAMRKEVNYTCVKCGEHNETVLSGLDDFLS